MRTIDLNTVGDRAPRPANASKLRALYDAVDAIGGSANIAEVISYLPCTDDYELKWKGKPIKVDGVRKNLADAVQRGYLVHNTGGRTANSRWSIAPGAYFKVRYLAMSRAKDNLRVKVVAEQPQHRPGLEVREPHSVQPLPYHRQPVAQEDTEAGWEKVKQAGVAALAILAAFVLGLIAASTL